MSKIIIKNIKELVQVEDVPVRSREGKQMGYLNTIKDAWLAIEDDEIIAFGTMEEWAGIVDWNDLEVIDATGKMVFPSFCDSHTHLVYAASREEEFVDRINGLSYQQIASKGGGILNSANKLRDYSEEKLFHDALIRLEEAKKTGTGAIEIKSGYGLNTDAEIKMLRVIKRLKEQSGMAIKSTFLGAHAVPKEYHENRRGYIDLMLNEMLPIIKEESLADFIDVFCEENYFTVSETNEILQAGIEMGLIPKIHVNQFTSLGGVQAGIKNKALSVDHLEIMKDEDVDALINVDVMPTLLPSCSFFLNIPYAPARRMIDSGLGVALASDFNPGSTPSSNILFVLSLACLKLKMSPEEAFNAATINSARAMGLENTHGSIAVGKKANVFITKAIPSYAYIPYSFGSNPIETCIINGKLVE